jgi:phosphoribosylformimino-5-aminoimidazole carboxamide ribotide isomerase
MIVIPAIDLKDGKCVRLLQGKRDAVTVYSDDPVSMAKHWQDAGAELLHIVDLDGAFSGEQKNLEIIKAIRKALEIPIQVGGGIRSLGCIESLLGLNIDRVIIGTSAVQNPQMLREACKRFPGRILVGVDARGGMVAVKGWEEMTSLSAIEFARNAQALGVAGIIYTDISRDGMLTGPNIEAMRQMVSAVDIPVIASGGVSGIDDIRALMKIEGLWGVITGKALYTGALDLKEAVKIVRRNA